LRGGASADILFDNFGSGDSYNTGSGATISDGEPINTDWDQGFGFTVAGGTFFLDSLDFAMGHVTGTNEITMSVYDSVGGLPGNVLEEVVVGGFGPFGQDNPPETAVFSGDTVLEEGEQYFFVASSAENAWLAWNFNNIGDEGTTVRRQDLGDWTTSQGNRVAARVNGSPVPAPGVVALLGVAGLVGRRRRRV